MVAPARRLRSLALASGTVTCVLFDLHTSRRDGWSVVSVAGDLDLTSAPALRSEIVRLVAEGTTRVVLDLSGVEFCDSVGLGALVGAQKRLRARGGVVRLAACSAPVRRVLELTSLDRAMTPFGSVDDAMAEAVESVEAV